MVYPVEIKRKLPAGGLVILRIGDISGLKHLAKYDVAPLYTPVGKPYRVEIRRVLAQPDERGRLCKSQVFGVFPEINVGSGLYADGIVKKVEIIKIHGYYLFLRIKPLELHGYNPLYRLLHNTFKRALCRSGIQLLGQLLGYGRAAAGALLPQQAALNHGAGQCDEVYS